MAPRYDWTNSTREDHETRSAFPYGGRFTKRSVLVSTNEFRRRVAAARLRAIVRTQVEHAFPASGRYAIPEVAAMTGLHPETIRRWMSSGRLRGAYLEAGKWQVRGVDLRAFLGRGEVA